MVSPTTVNPYRAASSAFSERKKDPQSAYCASGRNEIAAVSTPSDPLSNFPSAPINPASSLFLSYAFRAAHKTDPTEVEIQKLHRSLSECDLGTLIAQSWEISKAAPNKISSDNEPEILWRAVLSLAATATGRQVLRTTCKPCSNPEAVKEFLDIATRIRKENPSLPAHPGQLRLHVNDRRNKDVSSDIRRLEKALNTVIGKINNKAVGDRERLRLLKVKNGLSKLQEKQINKKLEQLSAFAKQTPVTGKWASTADFIKRTFNPKGYQNPFESLYRMPATYFWKKEELHPEQMKVAARELNKAFTFAFPKLAQESYATGKKLITVEQTPDGKQYNRYAVHLTGENWQDHIRREMLDTLLQRNIPLVHGTCLTSEEKERLAKRLGDECIDLMIDNDEKSKLIDLAKARDDARQSITKLIDKHNGPFDKNLFVTWKTELCDRIDTSHWEWENFDVAVNSPPASIQADTKKGAFYPSSRNPSDVYAAVHELVRNVKPNSKFTLTKGGEQGISTASVSEAATAIASGGSVRIGIDIPYMVSGATAFSAEHTGSAMQYTIGWDEGTKKGANLLLRAGVNFGGPIAAAGVIPGVNVGYSLNNTSQKAALIRIPFNDKGDNRAPGLSALLNIREGTDRLKPLDRIFTQYPDALISYVQGEKTEDTFSAGINIFAGAELAIPGINNAAKVAPRAGVTLGLNWQYQREKWHAHTFGQSEKDANTRASKNGVTLSAALTAHLLGMQRGEGGMQAILAANRSVKKEFKKEDFAGLTLAEDPEGRITKFQKTVKYANPKAFFDEWNKRDVRNGKNDASRSSELPEFISSLQKDKSVSGAFELNYELKPDIAERINGIRDLAKAAAGAGDDEAKGFFDREIATMLTSDASWHPPSVSVAKTATNAYKPWVEASLPYMARKNSSVAQSSKTTHEFKRRN